MVSTEVNNIGLEKRVLSKIFDSLEEGLILVDKNRGILFLNDFIKKYLNIYNYENQKLDDILKISKSSVDVSLDLICPPFEIQKDGLIYSDDSVFLETGDNSSKIAKIASYKFLEFMSADISCLIIISDSSKQRELEQFKKDFQGEGVLSLTYPINEIRANVDYLNQDILLQKLEAEDIKKIQELSQQVSELQAFVENLVQSSKVEEEIIKLNLIPTNIAFLIKQIVEEQKLVAARKNIRVIFLEPLYSIPSTNLDSIKIYDVISSVIKNSIKYSDNGEIIISLTKEIGFIVIKISDKGVGISEKDLRNIFSKFYRLKTKSPEQASELGISLYLCKKILEAHLGNISVDSIEKVGTTVTLKLPIN